jgi:cytochrome c-type biogenesis protein
MPAGPLALACVAGVLSTLSPCVLPILPIVLGAAAAEHRLGPVALAAGLAASFAVIGLFAATIGYSISLPADLLRSVSAVLMIAAGTIILVPRLEARLALAAAPLANWGGRRLGGTVKTGLAGQLSMGFLLGAVWSPCVGPTLGAASILAAQGRDLGEVGATMVAFGLGAALPLAGLGLLSREALLRSRSRIKSGSAQAKAAFAVLLAVIGVLVLSGLDRRVETVLVDQSPQWLTDLTTQF